jgi:hypothetical protein
VFQAPNGKTVLIVRVEDVVQSMLENLRREHQCNEEVSAIEDTDKLGTEFSVNAIQRALDSEAAGQLGLEMLKALLHARGAMLEANRLI